jgi:type I restriction enzyme S subunit
MSRVLENIPVRTGAEVFAFVTSGSRGWAKYYSDTGSIFLRMGNLDRGTITLDLADIQYVSPPEGSEGTRTKVNEGDILISITADLGMVGLVPQSLGEAYINQHVALARPTKIIEPRYGAWFLASKHAQDQFDENRRGAVKAGLRLDDIRNLRIPLPPLPEQRRIVARIEELFSRLDAGVAALRHAKAQLQRYRQSVLAAAVTGQLTQAWRDQHPDTEPASELLEHILEKRREQWSGRRKYKEPAPAILEGLPEIPTSWAWASPDQLSAPEDYALSIGPFGSNLKVSDYTEAGVPLVFVRNIRANDYKLSPKFVSAEKAAELKAHSIDSGDILVTKMGEPPGDASLYPEGHPHAIITADCIKLRLTGLITSKSFFMNAINSQVVAKQIVPLTRGVAQKKISLDRFRDVALPLPPLAEQHQIVAEVEARTTAIDHLEAELDRQITRSTRLRHSTLASAFAAKL